MKQVRSILLFVLHHALATQLLLRLMMVTMMMMMMMISSSKAFAPPAIMKTWAAATTTTTTTTYAERSTCFIRMLATKNDNYGSINENDEEQDSSICCSVDMADVGFILLAGGKGSRMKANMPKQFLALQGKPVLQHSLDLFLEALPTFLEAKGKSPPSCVVLVLDPTYQTTDYAWLLDTYNDNSNNDGDNSNSSGGGGGSSSSSSSKKKKVKFAFANPGTERQGSVENGLAKLMELSNDETNMYAAIHDSARPLVTIDEICRVVQDAKDCKSAAVLGVPCKATIKESEDGGQTVLRTIPRSRLWEVHTPQVVKVTTLQRGFRKVMEENLEVTDDVSIVEALGETVKLTLGEYTNLKITTPEDMDVASSILEARKQKQMQ